MAVRHHLAVLDKAGLVSTTLERGRAGRPTYLYSPTESADSYFPNEYAEFAPRLLQAVVELDGEAKLEFIFSRIKSAEFKPPGSVLNLRCSGWRPRKSELPEQL